MPYWFVFSLVPFPFLSLYPIIIHHLCLHRFDFFFISQIMYVTMEM